MNQKIEKKKVIVAWPKEKRDAARKVIIWDLKTYKTMKQEVEDYLREIDEEASPSATDVRENVYTKSREIYFKGGFNTSIVIGHETLKASDSTPDKADALSKYRNMMLAATEYREMSRRIRAIETVYERLKKSPKNDDILKARLIDLKFFTEGNSDDFILKELHISQRTFFRWKNSVIREIAKNLGFVV